MNTDEAKVAMDNAKAVLDDTRSDELDAERAAQDSHAVHVVGRTDEASDLLEDIVDTARLVTEKAENALTTAAVAYGFAQGQGNF